MSGDRHSVAETLDLIKDPLERAEREAENGSRQYRIAVDMIRSHIGTEDRPFKLRTSAILELHHAALEGIHPLAGTFRNTPVSIGDSKHVPPKSFQVSEEMTKLCDYVNSQWNDKTAIHLASYVLWKINWIHPFADGNGRTARIVSYLVLNIHLGILLPGAPTIPEQIAKDKGPYYDGLEDADLHWTDDGIDVSALEAMLDSMLSQQLLSAAKEASGSARWGLNKSEAP